MRDARDTLVIVVIIHHRDETCLADAFGSHHTQNRTHGIFRLQPPRATERERERDSRRAQEWPQQLRSTKRAQRQRERSCSALLSCFTVPCALLCACCLARTQQLHSFPPNFNHLPDCSHTGSVALSFAGRQKQVAGACGFSSSRNCVLLSGILIQIPFRFIGNSIRFDLIAKLSEFVFCKIKFAVHCLHIDRTTLLPISSSFPLTQILSKLSIVQSAHTHSRTHTQIRMYPYRLRNSHV